MLFDAQMNLRLELPGSTATRTPGPILRGHLAAALRSNDAVLTDLHRPDAGGPIHLDLIVPVIPSDPAPAATRPAPIAVIVLLLNPESFLFPMIQTWPTPSATAETLLVRREGDEVVYLNELRHRKGTALALRRPVSDPLLPAAMIARGERGVFEGIDYRGVPVLSSVRAVPDSPWMLVTKVDQAEAYAPIRAEAWRTGLMVSLLLVTVVLAAAYLWRQRHAALLHHELILERERKALAERLALITRHANDIILLLDETGRIVEANDRALTTYGYTLDELRQLPPVGLRPPGAQENLPQQLDLFASREGAVFETVHRRRDGTTFPVEVSGRSVEIEGRQFSLGIYRDLTERKQAEESQQLAHQRLRRFVDSNVVGIVIVDAAGAVVEANDYYLRLIGYTREELEHGKIDWRAITPPEWLPADEQALGELRERGTCTPYEKEYVRRDGTRVSVFLADTMLPGPGEQIAAFALDITARKRAEEALQHEFAMRSMLLENLPCTAMILRKGTYEIVFLNEAARQAGAAPGKTCYGTLAQRSDPCPFCLAPEVWATNQPRQLEVEYRGKHYEGRWIPLTDDLYVHYIFDITEHKRAEEAVRNREDVLQKIFDLLPVGLWFADKDGKLLRGNPAGVKIWGAEPKVDPSEYGVFKARRLPSGEEVAPDDWALAHTIRDRVTIVDELLEIDAFDGQKKTILNYTAPVLDAQGEVQGAIVVNLDITDRKRAEESLRGLSLRLIRAKDEERRRIARELHDSTGQKLAALSMTVGLLQDATGAPDGKTNKMFTDCLAMIEQCAQEIRTHSYLLHPPLLDELGLAAAIRNYVEGFSKRSGVQIALDAPPDLERLPTEVELALFRVVQESLGNIHRHAGASTARIRLACDAEQVTLEVTDQGHGMSAETMRAIEAGRGSAGVGIAGMQERLRLLGGRLEIKSGEQGTLVRAIIPQRQEPT
jgi:PAS domain S-box-containing protein